MLLELRYVQGGSNSGFDPIRLIPDIKSFGRSGTRADFKPRLSQDMTGRSYRKI